MSGIAEVLLNLGFEVTGSDLKESYITKRLTDLGAEINFGHSEENIKDQDVCVFSSAVSSTNVELEECRKHFIPIIPRGEMLAELMRLKHGVVVAGSHGKTTITSMIGAILIEAGLDPTIILGGRLSTFESGAKLGEGDLFVAEIDESDGSFLKVAPAIGVISSIDREHIEFYGTMENMKDAFLRFANKVPFYGAIIFCLDDKQVQEIVPQFEKKHISYGLSQQAEVRGADLEFDGFSSSFTLFIKGDEICRLNLPTPGVYNVRNALAAWAVAEELGIDRKIIISSLEGFESPDRRFQSRGVFGELIVIEDYAHHPTAIRAVLNAAKNGFSKIIIAVCQPHRYSRVKDLEQEFYSSFNDADIVIMTDIYSAGEANIDDITGEKIASEITRHGHRKVLFTDELKDIPEMLFEIIQGDELIIFLGAGDISKIIDKFLDSLKSRFEQK